MDKFSITYIDGYYNLVIKEYDVNIKFKWLDQCIRNNITFRTDFDDKIGGIEYISIKPMCYIHRSNYRIILPDTLSKQIYESLMELYKN